MATFSTTTFGTTIDGDRDISITADQLDIDDPTQSSPAGGAGTFSAVERFTGLPSGSLDASGATEEQAIAYSQQVSDELLAVREEADLSASEASSLPAALSAIANRNESDGESAVGESNVGGGGGMLFLAIVGGIIALAFGVME